MWRREQVVGFGIVQISYLSYSTVNGHFVVDQHQVTELPLVVSATAPSYGAYAHSGKFEEFTNDSWSPRTDVKHSLSV